MERVKVPSTTQSIFDNLGLDEKKSEVRIQFREVPGDIYAPGELKRFFGL